MRLDRSRAGALLAIGIVTACGGDRARPPAAARAGTHGFRLVTEPPIVLPAVIVSPSGRRITPGERDRNGVVLPLDAHLDDIGEDPGRDVAPPRRPGSSPRTRLLAGSQRLGDDDGETALAIAAPSSPGGTTSPTPAR